MLERYHTLLKILCAALAILIAFQIARLGARTDPLDGLKLPTLDLGPANIAASETAKTNPPAANTSGSATQSTVSSTATNRASSPARATAPTNALPGSVQSRVDRITQSEILGAIVRPKPLALLGIAGNDAFLRTPAGQTILLR